MYQHLLWRTGRIQSILLKKIIRLPKIHVSCLNSRLPPDCSRLTVFVSSTHLRAVYCATLLGLDDWRVTWLCCFVVTSRGILILPHQLQFNQNRMLSCLPPDCSRLTVFILSTHLRAVYCATLLGLDDRRETWPCCFVVTSRGILILPHQLQFNHYRKFFSLSFSTIVSH